MMPKSKYSTEAGELHKMTTVLLLAPTQITRLHFNRSYLKEPKDTTSIAWGIKSSCLKMLTVQQKFFKAKGVAKISYSLDLLFTVG